jgi:hypothetical protein
VDGDGFNAFRRCLDLPVATLQIIDPNGGPRPFNADRTPIVGPSVSWNTYLKAWVMPFMVGKKSGPSWQGVAASTFLLTGMQRFRGKMESKFDSNGRPQLSCLPVKRHIAPLYPTPLQPLIIKRQMPFYIKHLVLN